MSRYLSLLSLIFSITGCAQNAILELQIALPAAPAEVVAGDTCTIDADCVSTEVGPHRCVGGHCAYTGPWYVRIEPVRADLFGFVDPETQVRLPWAAGGTVSQLDSAPLESTPRFSCTSVVTGNASVDAMNLRVRFCRSPTCSALLDDTEYVEEWYRIETPFYTGRRTFFRNYPTPTPAVALDVPYCSTERPCTNGRPCVNNHCGCASDADCGDVELGWECSLPEGQCLRTITRCNVAGCIDSTNPFMMSRDGFCRQNPPNMGRHFCELQPSFDYTNPCAE